MAPAPGFLWSSRQVRDLILSAAPTWPLNLGILDAPQDRTDARLLTGERIHQISAGAIQFEALNTCDELVVWFSILDVGAERSLSE